jgi:hypothetical protein
VVYSSHHLFTEGTITMLYVCIIGFALFAIATVMLFRRELVHMDREVEMKLWADEVLDMHSDLIKQLAKAQDRVACQDVRIAHLEAVCDYVVDCNNELVVGYTDAARTIVNMTASIEALSDELDGSRIAYARVVLGGVVSEPFTVDSIDEDVDIPISYYIPDQDQG